MCIYSKVYMIRILIAIFFGYLVLLGCSHTSNVRHGIEGKTVKRENLKKGRGNLQDHQEFYGLASYYAEKFHGKQTANGEIYDMNKLTAAHKTLPFGTICQVTNLDNKKKVVVRINDRGPFVEGRVIDLSKEAAKQLNGINHGLMRVKIEILSYPQQQ